MARGTSGSLTRTMSRNIMLIMAREVNGQHEDKIEAAVPAPTAAECRQSGRR